MATQILAVGTGAGTSSNVTVSAGTPITVGLFITGGGTIPQVERVLCDIQDSNTNWTQTQVYLDAFNPTVVLIGPGVYRFRRVAAETVSVGVMTG